MCSSHEFLNPRKGQRGNIGAKTRGKELKQERATGQASTQVFVKPCHPSDTQFSWYRKNILKKQKQEAFIKVSMPAVPLFGQIKASSLYLPTKA